MPHLLNFMPVPELVNQVDDQTCGHACLAMVTGRSIDEVIAACGSAPLSDDKERLFLAMHGILGYPVPVMSPYPRGVYLVSRPSLNVERQLHRVVVYTDPEIERGYPWVLLDPQRGRPDRLFYERFGAGEGAWCEMVLLRRPANIEMSAYLAAGQENLRRLVAEAADA